MHWQFENTSAIEVGTCHFLPRCRMHSWFTLLSLSLKQFPIRENRRETPSLLWRPTIYDRRRQAALEKKCLVLVVTMATIFLLCWLPWYIVMLLYRIMNDVKELEIPAHVFVLVRYATSVTNPVLYTLFRRDFQTALKFLFKIKRFKRRSRASDAETLQIKHRHW